MTSPKASRAAKKKPNPKVKPAKRKGTPRSPPMHAKVAHPELSDWTAGEVFQLFKAYDADGSGSIDRAELATLLEALGQSPSEEELEVALDVVDANHSGKISWDEFRAWWSNQ